MQRRAKPVLFCFYALFFSLFSCSIRPSDRPKSKISAKTPAFIGGKQIIANGHLVYEDDLGSALCKAIKKNKQEEIEARQKKWVNSPPQILQRPVVPTIVRYHLVPMPPPIVMVPVYFYFSPEHNNITKDET